MAKLNLALLKTMVAAADAAHAAAIMHAMYLAPIVSIVAFHSGLSGSKVAFHSNNLNYAHNVHTLKAQEKSWAFAFLCAHFLSKYCNFNTAVI